MAQSAQELLRLLYDIYIDQLRLHVYTVFMNFVEYALTVLRQGELQSLTVGAYQFGVFHLVAGKHLRCPFESVSTASRIAMNGSAWLMDTGVKLLPTCSMLGSLMRLR